MREAFKSPPNVVPPKSSATRLYPVPGRKLLIEAATGQMEAHAKPGLRIPSQLVLKRSSSYLPSIAIALSLWYSLLLISPLALFPPCFILARCIDSGAGRSLGKFLFA